MKLGRSNIGTDDLSDIVDSMPFNSEWAPGELAGCDGMGDVSASVGVNPGGVRASGGFDWTTIALIAGGFWLFRKYFK